MKKILILGGNYPVIPFIKEARERGFYVITCDYLPENPGHKFSDEYHNVSTTDTDGVLSLALKIKPDYIVDFMSDHGAQTAAYVSEKLSLPANNYNAVRILANKDLFRKFQTDNGFNAPKSIIFTESAMPSETLTGLTFPVIIKPTDSSGSRGIRIARKPSEVPVAMDYAFKFSRSRKIIIEEYVVSDGPQLHGDGFVENGNLLFAFLGDHQYARNVNSFIPICTKWPSKKCPEKILAVENEVARLIKKVGFKNGPINIEARITKENKIFIMELGPRCGGNFVPMAIKYATGFNSIKASLDILSDTKIFLPESIKSYSANFVIHSSHDGVLKEFALKEAIIPYIREFHQYVHINNLVRSFNGSNAAIGLLVLTFKTRKEMEYILKNIKRFLDLKIEAL